MPLTRKVKLHTGLIVGEGGRAMEATIREETLGDELDAVSAGLSGRALDLHIAKARVVAIGDLANPVQGVLKTLSRTDWELIELAQQRLDLELSIEAGLITTGEVEGSGSGRDEPGGAAPGDA